MSKFKKLNWDSPKDELKKRTEAVRDLQIKKVSTLSGLLRYTGVEGEDLWRRMKNVDKAILGLSETMEIWDEYPDLQFAAQLLSDERVFLKKTLMQILKAIDAPKADLTHGEEGIGDEIEDEEGGAQ